MKGKKKPYKIVKTKLFKEQEKKLPKDVKKSLDKTLKAIAKDPKNAPNSMNVFGKPTPEELKQWMSRVQPRTVDLVLEYLSNKECLNVKGRKLAQGFYDKYIKENKKKLKK